MKKPGLEIPPTVADELAYLPEAYDGLSDDLRLLAAALRVYGFTIVRADDAQPVVSNDADLWTESGHPSIWIAPPDTYDLKAAARDAVPGSPEHTNAVNKLVAANMQVQLRLLSLLDGFYSHHVPTSFYARLIAQTNSSGETYLKSQGADVRVVLPNQKWQRQLFEESNAELLAFAHYLCERAPAPKTASH